MDRWETFSVIPEGGIVENLSPLVQGEKYPGSLLDARNFEPSPVGGYRRIKGFSKFDANQVNSSATQIDAVFMLGNICLALQNKVWYKSSGAGWTSIHTLTNSPVSVLATKYNWSGTDCLIIVDGANAPIHFDGTTLTEMVSTNSVDGGTTIDATTAANILNAQAVQEFHGHMFYSVGEFIRFSAPNDAGVVTGSGGSGEFITGSEKTCLIPWRENLYCLGNDRIGVITGNSSTDFTYKNVTHKVGTVSPQTVQEMNGDIYFLSFDGVRTIAGTVRNDDIELGAVTRNIPSIMETLAFRNSGRDVHAVSLRDTSQYRLFVGNSASTDEEGEGLLGGLRLNSSGALGLEWFNIKGINASCSDSGLYLTEEYVVHGGYDGYVYRQEQGTSFNGANVSAFLRFPYWSIGLPEIRKTFYHGKIYIDSESQIDPTLGYNFDYNTTGLIQPADIDLSTGASGFAVFGGAGVVFGTAVFGSAFPTDADVNLIGSGNNVSFTVTSDDILGTYSIQSITVEYGKDGRR